MTPLTASATVATAADLPALDVPAEHLRLASSAHVDALAGVLFDWRVECEEHLRVLTSIQRYVEKVRSPSATLGERVLLMQEISRLLGTMAASDDWRQRAAALAVSLP